MLNVCIGVGIYILSPYVSPTRLLIDYLNVPRFKVDSTKLKTQEN